jgi:hypothetical protein
MNTISNRFEVDTSSNALAKFGFGKWGWRLFTRKANLILLLSIALIGLIVYLIVLDFMNGSCTSDKTPILIKFLLIFGITIFISNGIYPHTQWRKVPTDASNFIGHNAVIAQQRGTYYTLNKDTLYPIKHLPDLNVDIVRINDQPIQQTTKVAEIPTNVNATSTNTEVPQKTNIINPLANISFPTSMTPPLDPSLPGSSSALKRMSYQFDFV